MKEHEEQGGSDSLFGEGVGIAATLPLKEAVRSHLTQVIPQLVEAVCIPADPEAREQGLVNISGTPAVDLCAGVEQNFDSLAGFGVRGDGNASEFPGGSESSAQFLLEGDSGFFF